MNLQQIKSQASLDQKLLIEKVEMLVRSEYDKDKMLEEIRGEYISRVGVKITKLLPDYKSFISPGEGYLFKEFVYKVGDILREIFEYDKKA
jgi:hypothetical protein